MIVLGLDTSGYINAVGVVSGERVLADAAFTARTDSLEQIVANIDDVLKGAGLNLDKIGGIGVGLGPGSWTGIRVGVTVGKMLAYSTGKPVCGVPTLEALAYAAREQSQVMYSVIGVGAGDAVYAGIYRVEDNDIKRRGDYYIGDVKGLAGLVKEPGVIAGEGASSYADVIARETGLDIKGFEARPGGAAVAALAAQRLARGENDDPLSLTPLYLKESTARIFVNKYRPD
jgi:tRNA threonylcarbamoyladenosine biosynthesis protein TsaB